MSKITTLKVGIDFGTTYSGVAWADTATPKDINVIQKWPLGGNTTTDKVPTELKYSKDYRHPGYRWGFQVEMEPERLRWFKLLLDPKHEHFPKALLEASKAGMPPDKMPVDLVTDYLSALKNHITTSFEEKYGKAFMKGTKIEYFLTVPAIWSDAAKALTLRAASSVGLGTEGTVPLITEPEAAAVYSLRILPHDLKIKDTFVIADCGGGTVDLISYEITALKPKLEVKECVGGTGGMCGSSFVNQAFEAWAKSRMGTQRSALQSSMSQMNMNKYFEEYLKRIFSDDEFPEKFFCTVPGVDPSTAAGIADGFLAITRAEMRALFDPVVSRVLDLVHQQIDSVEALGRDVSAVVLVGGFGGSEYLRKRLKEVCNAKGIELFNPENAWTAVARGACLRGLEGLSIVRSHISPLNYGVHCLRTVASGPGNPQGSYVCPLTGQTKIPNRVNWLIRKVSF
ncbi:hypothetical protein DFP73DRAFT_285211 [Morchella snyderi]|nr:hypothetical protein DFP73DRAFT_285211 [Morchella snyderi]